MIYFYYELRSSAAGGCFEKTYKLQERKVFIITPVPMSSDLRLGPDFYTQMMYIFFFLIKNDGFIHHLLSGGSFSLNNLHGLDRSDLDLALARQVGEYFQLDDKKMDRIINEVESAVNQWQKIATDIGIARNEQTAMQGAFRFNGS